MPAPAPCRRGVERLVYPGGDTALLVFIPLPDGASLAALRLLAQHCEPLFFQRLRVEQQIGYVVSCRYQRVADRDGLLMALQSPDRRAGELLRCGKDFLRQLAPMDEATFRPLQQRLAAQIRASRPPEARALSALRQEYGLPELTPQAVDALRVAEVADLAREMTHAASPLAGAIHDRGLMAGGIRGQKGADEARKDRRALRALLHLFV